MDDQKDKSRAKSQSSEMTTTTSYHRSDSEEQMEESDRWSPRNPSPPPELNGTQLEIGASGDTIGDTVFSERFVITTIMKLAEFITRNEKQVTSRLETDDENDEESIRELDKDFEDDLCQLWDMSACNDVVTYLLTIPSIDIFADSLGSDYSRTFPRLTEVVSGICGNMVCVTNACNTITKHARFVSIVTSLLDSTDSPTLTELLRFFTTCIQNPSCQSSWLKLFEEDHNFLPHLTFIMSSSTSGLLLKSAADFVDSILDIDHCDFCTTWATTEFVESVVEAIHQIGFNDVKIIDVYLHILQLLSTTDNGKETISGHSRAILTVISKYLTHALDDDFVDLEARAVGFASAVQLWQILITCSCSDVIVDLLEKEHIRSLLKLLESVGRKTTQNETIDEGIVILKESMALLFEDLLSNRLASSLLLRTLNDREQSDIKRIFNFITRLNEENKVIDSIRLYLTTHEEQQLIRIVEILNSFNEAHV